MRLPRVRITIRGLILIVLSVGIVLGVWVDISRRREIAIRRTRAEDHERQAQFYLGRIPVDLGYGLICVRLAVEGGPGPRPFASNSSGFVAYKASYELNEAEKIGHIAFIKLSPLVIPDPKLPAVSSWAKESVWWIGEAGRDWARLTWHLRMKKKYELAASLPREPIPPDPLKPFDDGW